MTKSVLVTCSLVAVVFLVSVALTSDVILGASVTMIALCFQLSVFWIFSSLREAGMAERCQPASRR
ncbi:hypothetical protein [Alteromonas sp. H39]|uniref:hypothetical protein n=1 Tax=Alteromonas sp. H39 TaxID=3389876 RepID=UPI0039DF6CE8